MKSLLTKKNVLAAVGVVVAAVLGVTVVRTRKDLKNIVIEGTDEPVTVSVSDISDEPVVEAKPTKVRKVQD